jgi:hypothetical protein
MGGGGALRGVALDLSAAGATQLARMLAAASAGGPSGERSAEEAAFGQDALVLSFVDREEVTSSERARLRRLGLRCQRAGAWPQLAGNASHRLPGEPRLVDVERMALALEELLEVARRGRETEELLRADPGQRRLVRLSRDADGEFAWRDDRRRPSKAAPEPVPEFDRVRAQRLRQVFPRGALVLECDLFPVAAPIADPGRAACIPAAPLVVDAGSSLIVHAGLTEPAGRYAWPQQHLMVCFERLGTRPARVSLQRDRPLRAIEPSLRACEVEYEFLDSLPELESARAGLERAMARS